MSHLHRALCPLAFLMIAVLLLFGGLDASHVCGQTKDVQGPTVPSPMALPSDLPAPPMVRSDAFTLPLDRTAKRKLEAAEDYIGEKDWKEAALMLQYVLDLKEDSFFLLPADPKRHLPERWTSTRAEAERLLSSLPAAGREFYQIINEPHAQKMLKDATEAHNPHLLTEAVRRFLYTKSGAEAIEQLGTYYLDRGDAHLAALAFQRRLERAGKEPEIAPLTLFKALLAFHAAGDKVREQEVWNRLSKHLDRGVLRIGSRTYTLEQLREQLPRWNSLPAADGGAPLYRGDLARSGRGSGEAPYLEPHRRIALTELDESRTWLKQAADAAPAGVIPLPGFVPISAGDKLIYRSHFGVHAFDTRTGKESWRTPSAFALDAVLRDPGKKVQMAQWFAGLRNTRNVLLENTITGNLSSDGQRVYAVEDLAIPLPPDFIALMQNGLPRFFGPFTDRAQPEKMHNTLRALSLETGAVEWEVGSSGPKAPPDLIGVIFLGPSLLLGNSLFVLVDQKQEIRLLCLRADSGEVHWSQSLGMPRDKIVLDLLRRTQAAQLAYADGVLVCPTGSGALLGIDPLNRSLLWAHNYRDRPQGPVDPNVGAPEYNIDTFQNCWKHCTPVISEGRVLFTAPDADSVRCLDLRNGTLLWKAARSEEDLYLGAVTPGLALIVGKNACRALHLGNGTVLWRQQTGRPSGEGALADKTYYLPLQQGAVLALNLDKPRDSALLTARGNTMLGNLLFHNNEMWSQTSTELTAFPQLATHLEKVEAQLRANPNDPVALLERGELRLDRGDLTGAIADLSRARELKPTEERPRRKLFDALTQLLQRDFNAGEKYLAEYRALGQVVIPPGATPEERQRLQREQLDHWTLYFSLIARGREQQGRLLEAVQAYRELYERTPSGERLTLLDDPGVTMRANLWIEAQLGGLAKRATPEMLRRFQAHLEHEYQALVASEDLDAVERFAAVYGALPGKLGASGREARLRLAEHQAASANRRLALSAELELCALQKLADTPDFAARALDARARLLTRHGLLEDAVALYRTLAKDYPGCRLVNGHTGKEMLEDLATDKRFLAALHASQPAWLGRKMQAKEMPNGGIAMNYSAMSVNLLGEAAPSVHRWRFLLDPYKWQLRVLERDTMLESWSVPVPSIDTRRYGVDGEMFRVRIINHLAIYNLGTTIIALDLLERRVRWSRNLLDEQLPFNRGLGLGADGCFMIYSNEGRILYKIGLVGPVTGSCLTVQTRQGLLGLDPIDGEVRWQRPNVSPALEVFGDDHHLYLTESHTDGTARAVRAVRSADGVEVPIPDAGDAYANKVRTLGHNILASEVSDKEEITLRLYDVLAGKDVWRKTLPKDSFLLDTPLTDDLVATATPKGEVSIFDVSTGKEIKKLAIQPSHLDKVTRGTLLCDAANYYVALVGPINPDLRVLDTGQLDCFGDLRLAPINGMLYVFDRDTGEVKTANRVANQAILLSRFEELPVVLFMMVQVREVGPKGSGQQVAYLCVQSMDKQTGKRLYNREQQNNGDFYHTLWVDVRSGLIDLIGPSSRVRHQVAVK